MPERRCNAAPPPSRAISVSPISRRRCCAPIRTAALPNTWWRARSVLSDAVSFDAAARFGYIGTSFAALRRGGVGAGSSIAINGVTGTLGAGATLLALGMGATRILGIGRNRDVLAQLKALSPARIDTLALGDAPVTAWLMARSDGIGVDVLLDCSGRAAKDFLCSGY